MTTNTSYHSFRSRETSELIAIVDMHDHMHRPIADKKSNLPRSNLFYLKCAYSIQPITLAEKETYCDAFDAVPVYDITDLAIIAINWLTTENVIAYESIDYE